VDDSLVNIITTYPGGRKVLQDAEVALSAKLVGQEGMVAYKLALELFREVVAAKLIGQIDMFKLYGFYKGKRFVTYSAPVRRARNGMHGA
jgi:hypothetical protein